MHPAGGNPHDPIDPTAPLWVKRKHHSCKHCDKTKQLHGDTDCSNFEPKEIKKMKYTAFYRAFKRACDRADIGDRRPYDLRHTRITEVAKYMGYEQLNKFAGWVPGSDRAKTYVHMISDDVNQAIREQNGIQTPGEEEKEACKFCGQLNPADRYECMNCQRPLSLEKETQQKDLRKAVELYNRLEDEGGFKTFERFENLVESANKIEELVD